MSALSSSLSATEKLSRVTMGSSRESTLWYCSASSGYPWHAWGQRFSDSGQDYYAKNCYSSVRCVR
jgi:hypothetical protein